MLLRRRDVKLVSISGTIVNSMIRRSPARDAFD